MKRLFTCLLIAVLSVSAAAQNVSVPKPVTRAAIEGFVTKDPDSQPVRKALIELIAENQSEGGNYTAVSGSDGAFRIENILPGRYHLFAERTGLLNDEQRRGRDGRILALIAGQELKDVHLRLEAAAVIRGRVTDEDGDPLANAEVSVLRRTFVRGREHWEPAGADRTNDLGEYRISNLPAGSAYVLVNPPPDLRTLIESGGTADGRSPGAAQKPNPLSYQKTYYPGTADRGQATPVPLQPGDDFPVNFSLVPSPSLSIRGSVVNVPPRSSATVVLLSRDLGVVTGAETKKDGSFDIPGVSPGRYLIQASVEGSSVPMTARQSLQLESANVEGVRLSPQPGATVRGRLRLDNKNGAAVFNPEKIFLTLQPMDGEEVDGALVIGGTFSNLANVAADGSFQWGDVPPGNYYVQLVGDTGKNSDVFLKSLLAGGRDVNDSGISVNGGAIALDLVASTNSGIVEGVVVDGNAQPVADAVVVAVPEISMRSRSDRYHNSVTDQGGHFTLHGIRPGEYTLFAWENVDGEAYYNPVFLKAYEGQGSALHVAEGERKMLQVHAIPEDQASNR